MKSLAKKLSGHGRYYSEDGFTVTSDDGGYMGIHSACRLLNEKDHRVRELEYCIKRVMWMAQRYANERSTYAPSDFNEALDICRGLGVEGIESIEYAIDGCFGEWDAAMQRFKNNKGEK